MKADQTVLIVMKNLRILLLLGRAEEKVYCRSEGENSQRVQVEPRHERRVSQRWRGTRDQEGEEKEEYQETTQPKRLRLYRNQEAGRRERKLRGWRG